MVAPLAAHRMLEGVAQWCAETTNPNAIAAAGINTGSWWLRQGAAPTSPTEMYLKTASAAVGWTKQNLVGLAILNVKAFGAVGDGVTDDTIAIRAAVTAGNAAGGALIYFPATPNYYRITKQTNQEDCIDLGNVFNLTFLGDGYASQIHQEGSAAASDTTMFGVHNGSAGIRFLNLFLTNQDITNPDPSSQNHGIQIYGKSGDTNPGPHNVEIAGCFFGRFVGDAVRTLGQTSMIVENLRIHHNAFDLFNGVIGSRSGVEAQRDTQRVQIHACWFTGSHDQQIDFEPTGGSGVDISGPEEWSIQHNHVDHRSLTTECITLSGIGATNPTLRSDFSFNTITHGGDVNGISEQSLTIEGNIITMDSTDASGSGILELQQDATGLVISSNVFASSDSTTNRPGVLLSVRLGVAPVGNVVVDNVIVSPQGTASTGININDNSRCTVSGNVIDLDAIGTANTSVGIQAGASILPITDLSCTGNVILGSGVELLAGIRYQAASFDVGNTLASYNVVDNATDIVLWQLSGGTFSGWRCANNNLGIGNTNESIVFPSTNIGGTLEGTAGPGVQISSINLAAGPSGVTANPAGSLLSNKGGGDASVLFVKESGAGVSGGTAGWARVGPTEVVMGAADITTSASTLFLAPGQGLLVAGAAEIQWASPRAGTVRTPRVVCTPGATLTTITYTVRKNGADTTVLATMSNAAATAVGSGSVAVAAGDLISTSVAKTGLTASQQKNVSVTLEFA